MKKKKKKKKERKRERENQEAHRPLPNAQEAGPLLNIGTLLDLSSPPDTLWN